MNHVAWNIGAHVNLLSLLLPNLFKKHIYSNKEAYMKITGRQLKQLIKEEVKLILEIKDEEDMGELLSIIGLSDMDADDPEIREALELWHDGISNHEETLKALGGDIEAYDMLTHKEFRRVFDHLYNTLGNGAGLSLREQLSRDPVADARAAVFVVRFSQGNPNIHAPGTGLGPVDPLTGMAPAETRRDDDIMRTIQRTVLSSSGGMRLTEVRYIQNVSGSPALVLTFEGGAVPPPGRRAPIARSLAALVQSMSRQPARIRDYYVARASSPETPLPGEANS
jgi:hypothetical protein